MGDFHYVIHGRGLQVFTSYGTLERLGVLQPLKVPYEVRTFSPRPKITSCKSPIYLQSTMAFLVSLSYSNILYCCWPTKLLLFHTFWSSLATLMHHLCMTRGHGPGLCPGMKLIFFHLSPANFLTDNSRNLLFARGIFHSACKNLSNRCTTVCFHSYSLQIISVFYWQSRGSDQYLNRPVNHSMSRRIQNAIICYCAMHSFWEHFSQRLFYIYSRYHSHGT